MKMSYLQRASRHISSSHTYGQRKSGLSAFAVFLIISICLIIFFFLRNQIASGFFFIKGQFAPEAPNTLMLAPEADRALISALQLENDKLRALVGSGPAGLTAEPSGSANSTGATALTDEIVASVIMRPPQIPYDSLVINMGSSNGLAMGDKVYAFSRFPIGHIVEIRNHSATVRLLSASGNKLEVLIGNSTTAVIAEGKGGGNFYLKLPKVTEIKKGDIVVRSYLPPEVISEIESVDSADGEAYTYAYFKLPINIHNLVYVIVKKNSAQ